MARPLMRAGPPFAALSAEVLGDGVDLSDFDPQAHDPSLLEEARRTWQQRVRTEFRSIQIMTRFASEVVGAGDPLEVYAGAADLVVDEIRHTALCAALCEALGATPMLPDPVELRDPERYLRAPMPERALTTAISMLLINETISVAFVEDLRERCPDGAVRRVLDATVADEEGHQRFGWAYVEESLKRFRPSTLTSWRHLVATTVAPHREQAARILREVGEDARTLDAHPEPARAALGLFSPVRQVLVFERCWREQLKPGLARLDLLNDELS